MGMNVNAFKCPRCATQMAEGLGPNWSQVTDAPQGRPGGSVIMLSCVNPECQAALGAYFIPAAPSS
jgi:hypothetical protein